MTLKTSWFNAGVYKNALRRFKWGSVLYFVILFFSVPFMFMVGNYSYPEYYSSFGVKPNMLIEDGFMVVPILTAYGVSVVVAVILYRYIHENKQSIAIHSMPVTRLGNYISNLFAGCTLMVVPVVINGIILLIMSLTGWKELFSCLHVIYWIGDNIEVLFIMFSISTFAAFLTGQWAAHIAITVLLHLLPIFGALGVAFFSNVFLYGYSDSQMSLSQLLIQNTPFVWLFPTGNMLLGTDWIHLHINGIVYKIMAVALYVATYCVYKFRKVEACGDVAAFKPVRHILKYGITALVMLAVSAVAYEAYLGLVTIIILNLVFGSIAYFATEMVLSKSLKVFGKYKGFLVFCVAASAFVCFFAFTNVFGYETRVPDVAKVEKATIYDYGEVTPFVEDEAFIKQITEIHKEHIKDVPTVKPTHKELGPSLYSLNFSYKLKNGKELVRQYWFERDEYEKIVAQMYKNETYKFKDMDLYYLNTEKIGGVALETRLTGYGNVYTYYFNGNDARRILEAYKNDVAGMSYEEIKSTDRDLYFNLELRTRDDNDNKLLNIITSEGEAEYGYVPYSMNFPFNENFGETMKVLRKTGHYESIMKTVAENLYIGVIPFEVSEPEEVTEGKLYYKEAVHTYKDDVGLIHEFNVSISDCVKLGAEDGKLFVQSLLGTRSDGVVAPGTYYGVYRITNPEETDKFNMSSRVKMISVNELPEYLKKYVE